MGLHFNSLQGQSKAVINSAKNENIFDDETTKLQKRKTELENLKEQGRLSREEKAELDAINERLAELNPPSKQGIFKMLTKDMHENFNNALHTYHNDTEAAKWANGLADMEVDGEKVVSGDAFNNFVKEHFPDVEFKPVTNYISVADATGSFTTYAIKQEAVEKAKQNAELQEQSGQDSAPDMGV